VALVQVFIQVLPSLSVNALPPMLRIHAVFLILIAVKTYYFTASFNEIFLCNTLKNDSKRLGRELGCVLAQNMPVQYSI